MSIVAAISSDQDGLTNYIGTVDSIIALAFVMVQRRARSRSDTRLVHIQSVISRRQLQW